MPSDATDNSIVIDSISFTGSDPPAIAGTPEQVPEPAPWLTLATGLLGLLGYGWRKRRTV